MSIQNVVTDKIHAPHFLIVGSGRLAHHLKHYFQSLQIKYSEWDRAQDAQVLAHNLEKATHVLLAVSDQAIESIYRKHFDGFDKVCVHFSGALHIPGVIAAHPLMTFGPQLYNPEFYPQIHFVLTGVQNLQEALPGLQNPFSILKPEQKSLYHAYCVLGGNFTTLLTQKMIQGLSELNIPKEAGEVYLSQILANVFANPQGALTGPIARKDRTTVEKNLQALENDPYQKIYQAFVKAHWPEY